MNKAKKKIPDNFIFISFIYIVSGMTCIYLLHKLLSYCKISIYSSKEVRSTHMESNRIAFRMNSGQLKCNYVNREVCE